jgi:hypothetical protein
MSGFCSFTVGFVTLTSPAGSHRSSRSAIRPRAARVVLRPRPGPDRSFRGQGHAAAVTAAWASLMRPTGRSLSYSTSRTNMSSQRVAARSWPAADRMAMAAGPSSSAGRELIARVKTCAKWACPRVRKGADFRKPGVPMSKTALVVQELVADDELTRVEHERPKLAAVTVSS